MDNNYNNNTNENNNPQNNGYNNQQFNNPYNNNMNNGFNNGGSPYNNYNNGYPPRPPYNQKPKDKLGLFSLIFGIASIVTSMLYFLGIPFAITAIVLSILSKNRIGRFEGTAVAGLCLGICGVCLGLLFFAVMLAMFSSPGLIDNMQQIYNNNAQFY